MQSAQTRSAPGRAVSGVAAPGRSSAPRPPHRARRQHRALVHDSRRHRLALGTARAAAQRCRQSAPPRGRPAHRPRPKLETRTSAPLPPRPRPPALLDASAPPPPRRLFWPATPRPPPRPLPHAHRGPTGGGGGSAEAGCSAQACRARRGGCSVAVSPRPPGACAGGPRGGSLCAPCPRGRAGAERGRRGRPGAFCWQQPVPVSGGGWRCPVPTASGAPGLARPGPIRGPDVRSAALSPAGVSPPHPGAAEAAAPPSRPGPLLPPPPSPLLGRGAAMPSDFISLLSADLDLESPKSLYSKGECGTGPGGGAAGAAGPAPLTVAKGWPCRRGPRRGPLPCPALPGAGGSFARPEGPLFPRRDARGRPAARGPAAALGPSPAVPPAAFLARPPRPQECVPTGSCAQGPAAAPAGAARRRGAARHRGLCSHSCPAGAGAGTAAAAPFAAPVSAHPQGCGRSRWGRRCAGDTGAPAWSCERGVTGTASTGGSRLPRSCCLSLSEKGFSGTSGLGGNVNGLIWVRNGQRAREAEGRCPARVTVPRSSGMSCLRALTPSMGVWG